MTIPTTLLRIFSLDTGSLPKSTLGPSTVQTVLEIVFGVLGAVALLIIVLAGFNYITSQGDPDKLAKSRNSIIYAAVGLAITISAYTIVTFVVTKL